MLFLRPALFRKRIFALQVDSRVRKVAPMTQDKRILAKLAGGDMVAIEAEYNRQCLATCYLLL